MSVLLHNSELLICTTDDSRTVGIGVNFIHVCLSQICRPQRTWQPSWRGWNVWCFTVAKVIYRANRKHSCNCLYGELQFLSKSNYLCTEKSTNLERSEEMFWTYNLQQGRFYCTAGYRLYLLSMSILCIIRMAIIKGWQLHAFSP